MPVRVLIAVAIVLVVGLLFVADRTAKVIKSGRRRREANRRLVAAAAQAEAGARQRNAAEQASGALTSVMPTIHDVDTRLVGQPSPPAPPRGRRRGPGWLSGPGG
jgi:hypothetical protein